MRAYLTRNDISRFRKVVENPIEFTEKIYYSRFFRDRLEKYINETKSRLKSYEKEGSVNKQSDVYKMYKRGDFTFEFFIGHCVPVYFKDSTLPASVRNVIKEYIGIVLDDYRVHRNLMQKKRRYALKIKDGEDIDLTKFANFSFEDAESEVLFFSSFIRGDIKDVSNEDGVKFDVDFILESSKLKEGRIPVCMTYISELNRRGTPVSVDSIKSFMVDNQLNDNDEDFIFLSKLKSSKHSDFYIRNNKLHKS